MNRKTNISYRIFLTILPVLTGLIVLTSGLYAQEAALRRAGTIVHAAGGEFEIIRSGIRRNYDPSVDYVEGTDIFYGDHINTFKSGFIEILLEPGDRLIRVSEQTSFSVPVSMKESDSGADIDLAYGRIRARVQRLVQGRSFEMRGPSAAAGVRGTDFGYDIIAVREGSSSDNLSFFPESNIYCLEGTIVVTPFEKELEKKEIIVSAGEMVVAKDETGFQLKKVDQERLDFWKANDFVTLLPFKDDTEKPGAPEPETPQFSWKRSEYRKASLVTGITGALMIGSAAALSWFQGEDGGTTALYIPGGIFISTSILSLILSLTAD